MHHNQHSDEPERRTIKHHPDAPKLEIGAAVGIKEGMNGVVLARYTPSGAPNEVRYIVEIISKPGEKRTL